MSIPYISCYTEEITLKVTCKAESFTGYLPVEYHNRFLEHFMNVVRGSAVFPEMITYHLEIGIIQVSKDAVVLPPDSIDDVNVRVLPE